MASVKPRVCVVTAGHLATCPRMLKAADALAEACAVRVVSVRHTAWADRADETIVRSRRWQWTPVDLRRATAPVVYAWSGLRHKAARRAAASCGIERVPFPVASAAYSRVHRELVRAIAAAPADFVYGGTTGALAAVAEAAGRARVRFGLDFEDFHPDEHGRASAMDNRAADRILRHLVPDATLLTTSSTPMAVAYQQLYGVRPLVIHNTFPLPDRAPKPLALNGSLRCYWFSQTIGPRRGLEDFVAAAGAADIACHLTLRGRSAGPFLDQLRDDARGAAPRLQIEVCDPDDPGSMVDLCREHHVGLALEQGKSPNAALALSNKVLTYPLAGLAVLMTDTPGQREFAADVQHAALAAPGDVAALSRTLARWQSSAEALEAACAASWDAARRRWHWEHSTERGALIAALTTALETS